MLVMLKEIRTSLALLQDQVTGIAAKKDEVGEKEKTARDELTFDVVLQHVEEEIEKNVYQKYKAKLEATVGPNKAEFDELKAELQSKLDQCVARETQNAQRVDLLDTQSMKSLQGLHALKEDLARVKAESKREGKKRKTTKDGATRGEMDSIRTEIAIMKAQHELFLAEGGARIDQLEKENNDLKRKLDSLTTATT